MRRHRSRSPSSRGHGRPFFSRKWRQPRPPNQSTAPTRCSRDWRYANLHATRRITTILHCNLIHLALQLACCTTACTSPLRCSRRACGSSRLLNVRVGSPGGRRPPARAGTAPPDAGQLELPADKKAALYVLHVSTSRRVPRSTRHTWAYISLGAPVHWEAGPMGSAARGTRGVSKRVSKRSRVSPMRVCWVVQVGQVCHEPRRASCLAARPP